MSYRVLLCLLCASACVPEESPFDGGDESAQRALIECSADGRITADAAHQAQPSARTRIGNCTVLTGGTAPSDALFGTVGCSSAASIVSCTDGSSGCSSDGAAFGPPGTTVSVSWTARDVPAASTQSIIPPPITLLTPQPALNRGTPYLVQWNGGGAAGTIRFLAAAPYRGSTAIIECTGPSSAGQLTIPGDVTEPLATGTMSVVMANAGVEQVAAGEFLVDVLVRGAISGTAAFDVTIR